jgi:dTDP-4-amino-4,6-dideoxygalactose transaminase
MGSEGPRDNLNVFLQERGIGTGVHYSPIHLYRCYGNTPHLPTAERVFTQLLSLPMHPGLSDDDVQFVIDSIRAFPAETSQGFHYVDGQKSHIAAG